MSTSLQQGEHPSSEFKPANPRLMCIPKINVAMSAQFFLK